MEARRVIPEWMLLMEMTPEQREAYLARKAEQERIDHMARVRAEQKRAFWTEFEPKNRRRYARKG